MLTCPKCNELNGDGNTNCFKCGAKLPQNVRNMGLTNIVGVPNTAQRKPNSAKIMSLAIFVAIVGAVLSIALPFIFKAAVINDSHYYPYVEYTFNWGLFATVLVGTFCLIVLLAGMYYIAKAIDDK